jgi:integrase
LATIEKRGNSYRIMASCGYDVDGTQEKRRMTWKPEPGMTERQIQKELNRVAVLFEEECQGHALVKTVKFQIFAEQWFSEYAEPSLRVRTIDRYKQYTSRTYEAIGHLKMDKIAPRQIQKFIHSLNQMGVNENTGGALSPKTIKNYLSFISTVFDYAIKMEVVKDNPCKNVTIPKQKKPVKKIYTLEEAQQLLDLLQLEPLIYQAFFVLAIYGGFRRGELMGLEWRDIDFDTGVVSISRTSQYTKEKGIFTDTTKTEESQRCLKMPDEVIALLRRYKVVQDQERLKCGDQWIKSDRLFVAWNGKPMNPNTPFSWFDRFCERTGMRKVSIHSFRHLNASLLISNNVDVRTVSAALGHSQTSTTLNIYSHAFAQAQARAAEAIANALPLNQRHA